MAIEGRNLLQNMKEPPTEQKERQRPMVEEVAGDEDVKEFYRLREINRQVPASAIKYLDEFSQAHLVNYRSAKGQIKIFTIKEDGKIVAGGQLELQDQNGQRQGHLGMKFVNNDRRGHGLASELVKKRLEVAKELGCKTAYSLIHKDNFVGLRSILKDGFDVASSSMQPGLEHLEDSYYAYRNLVSEQKPTKIELERVKSAVGKTDMSGNEILIPFEDKVAIENALQAGFIGKFAFEENELPGVIEKMVYFEK